MYFFDQLSATCCNSIVRSKNAVNKHTKPCSPTAFKILSLFKVWFWGKGRRGQCGQGDMLDRLQPSVVPSLSKLGVQKVSCGRNHCLAITLTGAVFGWGDNSMGQSCPQVSCGRVFVQFSPVKVMFCAIER
jgi:hypothetical protein